MEQPRIKIVHLNFRLSTIYIGTFTDVFIGTLTDSIIFVNGTTAVKGKMKNQIARVDVNKLPKSVSQPYLLTKNFDFNIHESRIVIRVLQQIKQHQFIKLGSQIDLDNNVVMRFRPKDLTVGNDLKLVYKALSSIRNKEIILNGTATDESGRSRDTDDHRFYKRSYLCGKQQLRRYQDQCGLVQYASRPFQRIYPVPVQCGFSDGQQASSYHLPVHLPLV